MTRTSTDSSSSAPLGRVMSHGRGGAGNIGYDPDGFRESEDALRIPTIKTPVYTTGRGGTGNMALNDDASAARAAQDVEAVPAARLSTGEFHGGRGGAGNVVYVSEEEEEERRRRRRKEERKYKGWADRGKEILFGKRG